MAIHLREVAVKAGLRGFWALDVEPSVWTLLVECCGSKNPQQRQLEGYRVLLSLQIDCHGSCPSGAPSEPPAAYDVVAFKTSGQVVHSNCTATPRCIPVLVP